MALKNSVTFPLIYLQVWGGVGWAGVGWGGVGWGGVLGEGGEGEGRGERGWRWDVCVWGRGEEGRGGSSSELERDLLNDFTFAETIATCLLTSLAIRHVSHVVEH